MFKHPSTLLPQNPLDLRLAGLSRRSRRAMVRDLLGRRHAVNTCDIGSNLTQNNARGPSQSLWGDCPVNLLLEQANEGAGGQYFWDDFTGGGGVDVAPGILTYSSTGTAGTTGVGNYGQWSALVVNSSGKVGQFADYTNLPLEGGVLGLVSGASGAAVNLQALSGPGFGFVDASSTSGKFRGKMWFECCVAFSSLVSTGNAMFIGLAGADGGSGNTPVGATNKFLSSTTASGLVNTNSFFGFYKPSASPLVNAANPSKTVTGSLFNDFIAGVYNVAAGTIQFPGSSSNLWTILTNTGYGSSGVGGTGTTLSSATFTAGNFTTPSTMKVKLGFLFDPTPACPQLFAPAAITSNQTAGNLYGARVRFFVNGVQAGAFLISSDIQASTFPSVWMNPMIAFQAGAGTAGVAYVDWIRTAQLPTY